MSIKVTCDCGAVLAGGDHLAGRRVSCPKCHQAVDVPAANKEERRQRAECACGKVYHVEASSRKRRLRCNSCGGFVLVPAASSIASGKSPLPANRQTGSVAHQSEVVEDSKVRQGDLAGGLGSEGQTCKGCLKPSSSLLQFCESCGFDKINGVYRELEAAGSEVLDSDVEQSNDVPSGAKSLVFRVKALPPGGLVFFQCFTVPVMVMQMFVFAILSQMPPSLVAIVLQIVCGGMFAVLVVVPIVVGVRAYIGNRRVITVSEEAISVTFTGPRWWPSACRRYRVDDILQVFLVKRKDSSDGVDFFVYKLCLAMNDGNRRTLARLRAQRGQEMQQQISAFIGERERPVALTWYQRMEGEQVVAPSVDSDLEPIQAASFPEMFLLGLVVSGNVVFIVIAAGLCFLIACWWHDLSSGLSV